MKKSHLRRNDDVSPEAEKHRRERSNGREVSKTLVCPVPGLNDINTSIQHSSSESKGATSTIGYPKYPGPVSRSRPTTCLLSGLTLFPHRAQVPRRPPESPKDRTRIPQRLTDADYRDSLRHRNIFIEKEDPSETLMRR